MGTHMPFLSYIGITKLRRGTTTGIAANPQSLRSPAATALALPHLKSPKLHIIRIKGVSLIDLTGFELNKTTELIHAEFTGTGLTELPPRLFEKNAKLAVCHLASNSFQTFAADLFRNNKKLGQVRI